MSDVHVFVITVDDDETFDRETRSATVERGLVFREFCSRRKVSCIKMGPEYACTTMHAYVFQLQRDAEIIPGLAAGSHQGGRMDLLQSLPDQSVIIAHTQFMRSLQCDGFFPELARSRTLYRISLRGGEIHDIVEIDTRGIEPSMVVEEAGEAPVRCN